MKFEDFIQTATGNSPYDYQSRLAALQCESHLINVPTGLGKTAAVVLAWVWNRVAQPDVHARGNWPRRLVYCLPMRTLVEQTRDEAEKWVKSLITLIEAKSASPCGNVGVHVLMGGEDAGGPFRLAYFEAVFRAADIRASIRATVEADSHPLTNAL